ncbi:MAG: amino acid ABC transporter permease [Alphaproteobacteria bacterium]|nr:amino acid ABC transporter permease [Alphaproteobacteria bacterium]
MATAEAIRGADEAPPRGETGILGWVRKNLFADWRDAILTLAVVAALVYLVPPLVKWALLDAVWGKQPSTVCRGAHGACWSFIWEKWRLILFGRFPYEEQWRPFVAMLALMAGAGCAAVPQLWNKRLPWLVGSGIVVFFVLMRGGVLGLTTVDTGLWGGLPLTVMLAVFGIGIAYPLSVLLALGRRSHMPIIAALCSVYIELIRGVPLISLLFMASFMLPLFLPTGFSIDAVLRAQVAIILFTAAYLAEVVRGGLQAIPRGQGEAASALGLSTGQSLRFIVLPQALRLVIPPMVNTFIGLFKDTSLVVIVSLSDLLLSTRQAIADPAWRAFFIEGYIFVAIIYFGFCYAMSRWSQKLERDLDTGHKR